MQVKETLNDGLKRGYTITVTAAELDEKVVGKLKEAQPEVEMKGFRKGKVPMAMMRKQFGPRLMGEAMQDAIDAALNEHIESSGDRPAAQPEMKMDNPDWKEGDDVVVNVTYETLPNVPSPDLSDVALERLVVKADEAAVDEALKNLSESPQAKTFAEKKGAAKDGDQVVIDFTGKIDGVAFDGGAGEDYPLVLGSNSFIPGFEDQLLKAKAGDEKAVTVSFPAEYQAAHLAGKEAVFDVTVKEVRAAKAPELDDELAKKFGADDLEALKGQIRERLEAEYKGASRAIAKRKLLDVLDGMVDFDLPASLVEAEAGQIAHQLWHEENPDHQGHDHPQIDPTDEHKSLAKRRVKLGLLLADIGQKAEVKVTDQELTQAIMNQARQYPGQERQFFEFVQQNAQFRQQLQAPMFEDKVVDHIFAKAKVTDKDVTKEELQAAVEALETED
ncbi:trigger factor [Loktanella fryxellensis]|uniref:Trigger factor n=1 Tax=Loktanella fryxellensis TaxID=245187 RepID=A0A1H7YH80_9RHOB|nr:trigger factor [Loktanella fryxellensis]SEM44677.1 trigger factor [Loktanella fryxellensis]